MPSLAAAATGAIQPPPSAPVHPISVPDLVPLAVLGRGAYSKILQVVDKATGSMFAMNFRKVDLALIHHELTMTEQFILS